MSALVIDTSAAIAVLLSEPGADTLIGALEDADHRVMSTGTFIELSIALEARYGPAGRGVADRFLRDAEIDLVPLDRRGADQAVDSWRRFGKGRHPAGLNLGDCFAYALAVDNGSPVLCTGDDFARTDIATVRPSV